MDCNQVETLLADYLGDELDAGVLGQVEAHLDQCAHCAEEVHGLQITVATLTQLDSVSTTEAKLRTQELQITRRTSLSRRIILNTLRTAAVLMLGVYLGRVTQSAQPQASGGAAGTGSAVAQVQAPTIHPQWIELAHRLKQNPSGLTGSLQYLARSMNR